MATLKAQPAGGLQSDVLRMVRVHFWLIAAYALSIIIFDSWNLMPSSAILQRWTMAAVMLVVTAAVWYLVRGPLKRPVYWRTLAMTLVLVDLLVAAVTVYNERGMASRAVMLFAVPITVSAVLRKRPALFLTAALSTATYVLTAVRYFVINPSEGYKIELYGVVGFYCAVFFILAAMLGVLISPATE